MQHKKQAFNQLQRTIDWNRTRGNTPDTLNYELEQNMLFEELEEFRDANEEVDRLDAILDLMFVSIGTLYKMGLSADQIVDAYEVVVKANEQKSANKDANGKIIKDKSTFTEPEPELQKILDKRF